MKVELELWQLIVLLIAWFSAVGWFGRLLLAQFSRRLDERFAEQEELRKDGTARWEKTFGELAQLARKTERELLELKADLPMEFVARPDYIRGQSVLEAKSDALYAEQKVTQLQVAQIQTQLQAQMTGATK